MAHRAVERDETVEVLQDRRWLGAAMLLAAVIFSLVIQSVGFIHSSWMLGDIAYHRGVALTMQGGSIQGEGPFAGLLSYYAGLYPLGLAIVSELVHRKFDAVLSAASWFGTLLMPAALAVLGTRFWPRNLFAIATFVAVGTLAVPWTTDWTALWVESVLPSGSSFWPVYPRDIALALVCIAVWATTASDRRIRTIGLGVVGGLCLLFHAQLTLLVAWFLVVYAGYRVYRERSVAPLLELAVAGVIGFVVAAWWLVPRIVALGVSGVLLISDHPSRIEFSPGLVDLFVALGSAGVLAILGVIGIVVTRTRGLGVTVPAIWVLAFVPLIILSRILPTFELFSERRLWLIASIGVIAFAAWAIILAARSRPTLLVVALITVTLVLPSVAGNLATVKRVNNAVDVAWRPGAAGLARQIDERPWIASRSPPARNLRRIRCS
jgi:hypothetical protein